MPRIRTTSCIRLAILLACSLPVAICETRADSPENARRQLQDAGLERHGDNAWLLPGEQRLRNQLAELPVLRERIVLAERQLEQQVEQNRQAWLNGKQAVAAMQQTLKRLPASDPQRPVLQAQMEQANQLTPPDRFAGREDVRAEIVRWSQARNTLTIRLLEVRQTIPDLLGEYARLATLPAVSQALQQIGGGQRLGPLRSLEPELRRLADFDPLVFTPWVPIYLQSGRVRLTAIVNERQPMTFSWNEYPERGAILTASAAQTLGIEPTAKAETRKLDFGRGRKLTLRSSKMGMLRLGQWAIPEMSVWILPPEGEDLGSQLDPLSLGGYSASSEPARLRLTLQTRE